MTTKDPWQIEFYRTNDGKSPVLEFIDELPAKDRAKVINHLKLLREFGTGLGMPHAKGLTEHKPLWELRPKPHRLIYFLHTDRTFIILHGFTKKQNKTPPRDIKTAERRMYKFLEAIE